MRQCVRNTKAIVLFPLQQKLRERATVLRYTYIAYLLLVRFEPKLK
jgi:hypothetical protein